MKFRKMDCINKRDYISYLPDDIISNILSRLHTKDAVRTCVLSKAWEFKWTSIYNIDIRVWKVVPEGTFVNFVDRVLFNALNVRCFRFASSDYSPNEYEISHMRTWLSTVFRRNVEKVTVESHQRIILPRSLLTCTSIRELDLYMPCTWKAPVNNYFPNLTKLYLWEVVIRNENPNSDTLMFHFPVLKTFEISALEWLNVRFVELYTPALISFSSENLFGVEIDSYIIKIIGASLQDFETYGDFLENFLLTGSTVSNADLNTDNYEYDTIVKTGLPIRRLLKECSSLKSLKLTYYLAQALAQSKSGLALSRFDKLESLYLYTGEQMFHERANVDGVYEGLFELLRSAPLLKYLAIEMSSEIQDDNDSYMMKPVPYCVVSHLEEIKFEWFERELDIRELHLAKYFLENCAQLKKLTIHRIGGGKDEVAEQLLKFPNASSCLTIVIK